MKTPRPEETSDVHTTTWLRSKSPANKERRDAAERTRWQRRIPSSSHGYSRMKSIQKDHKTKEERNISFKEKELPNLINIKMGDYNNNNNNNKSVDDPLTKACSPPGIFLTFPIEETLAAMQLEISVPMVKEFMSNVTLLSTACWSYPSFSSLSEKLTSDYPR